MSDLVADGADFQCDKGGKQKLTVFGSPAWSGSKKLASETNCMLFPAGGACSVMGLPCSVPTNFITETGQKKINIDGSRALGASCEFMCPLGGKLTATSTAQKAVTHNEASGGQKVVAASAEIISYEVVASHLWEAREHEKVENKKGENVTPAEKQDDKENIEEYNTKSNMKKGREVHQQYKKDLHDRNKGRIKEYYLKSGKKVDFVDGSSNPVKVFELKPNNPKAIKRGKNQLDTYISEIKNDPRFEGREIIGIIEVY